MIARLRNGIGFALALVCGSSPAVAGPAASPSGTIPVYVGTYTWRDSKGIYLTRLDPATGALEPAALVATTTNPTFLALHPARPLLYAIGEIGDFRGGKTGAVSAYAIDEKTGALTLLDQQPSGGAGPCHLVIDRTGKHVLVANYGGGSVASLPIGDDGRLGEATSFHQHRGSSINPKRQEAPHAHGIYLDAANRHAFVPDLGIDKVVVYRFDPATGALTPNVPPWAAVEPGSGPRHFAFHPNGRFGYAINELASTVTAFAYDAGHGTLTGIGTVSTLPDDFKGANTTAEVFVHPSGRFLYGSNRGHDSIAAFAIDASSGKLRPTGRYPTGGKTPRNFAIDPTGRFLVAANQDTNSLTVFRIDQDTGALAPAGAALAVPMPVCVLFSR